MQKKKSLGLNQLVNSPVSNRMNSQMTDNNSFPMDPRTAVINFSKYLMEFEKTEIIDYDKVYFLPIN